MILVVVPFSFVLRAIEIFTHAVATFDCSTPLSCVYTSVFLILLWSFIYYFQCSIRTVILFFTTRYIYVLYHSTDIINIVWNEFIINFFCYYTPWCDILAFIGIQLSVISWSWAIEFFKSFNVMSFFIIIAFTTSSDAHAHFILFLIII